MHYGHWQACRNSRNPAWWLLGFAFWYKKTPVYRCSWVLGFVLVNQQKGLALGPFFWFAKLVSTHFIESGF